MNISTIESRGLEPISAPPLVWMAAAVTLAAIMGAAAVVANADLRIFAMSVLVGGLLGTFIPRAVPFVYATLVVLIPVHILETLTDIPYLAGDKWGFTKLHPATVVIVVAAVGYRLAYRQRWQAVWRTDARVRWIIMAMALFVFALIALSVARLHAGGVAQATENYLGPVLLFVLVLAEYRGRPRRIAALISFFVLLLTAVAAYGIVEYVLRCNVLYGPLYEESSLAQRWYASVSDPEGLYRITTSLGHPLSNAQYFLLAAILAATLVGGRSALLRMLGTVALPVLLLGTVATGARSAVLLLLAAPLFVLFLQRRLRALLWVLLLGGLMLAAVSYSPVSDVLKQRFGSEEGVGSAAVRLQSIQFIPAMLSHTNPLIGNKLGFSYEISDALFAFSVPVGFENPWLMLLVDAGVPLATLYVLIVARLLIEVLRGAWKSRASVVIFPAVGVVATLLMYSGYNSFGTKNTINYLLWFSSALVLSEAGASRFRPDPRAGIHADP